MNKQRVLIFQDGVKLTTPQNRWGDVDMLTNELVSVIRHPDFDYSVVDISDCLKKLSEKLGGQRPSCVIDLSGFLRKSVVIDPEIPLFNTFRLSRVRNVSSPLLDGVGFTTTLDAEGVRIFKQTVNFYTSHPDKSRPLIFDDVSWSGRTIFESMKRLGLDASSVNVGVLVCNEGKFGDKTTKIEDMRAEGARVFAGIEVHTPQDDGFHLADFTTPNISEDVFDAMIAIQILRERKSVDGTKEKEVNLDIKAILTQMRDEIFPNAKTSGEMTVLKAEGRLINNGGISRDSFFDTNPPNWLLPSFSMRVESGRLKENKKHIIEIMREFKSITEPNNEIKREIGDFSEAAFRGKER